MTITLESITSVLGIMVTMGAAITYMYKFQQKAKEPYEKVVERLDHHDECLKRDNKRLRDLEEEQRNVQDDLRQLLLSVNVMLTHMETGNNTGEIKKARADLSDYLIKRK